MKRAYIYPVSGRDQNLGLYNPYLDDFIDSSSEYFDYVNKDNPSKTGILNVIKYLFKLDFIFLNWIEKVPELKWGTLQTYFVLLLFPLCNLLGVRLIWTMHNKLAHTPNRMGMKRKIFKSLLKHADFIITHSSDGIAFGEEMVKGSASKIFYLPHPVKDRRMDIQKSKEYDILIWGTIAPYKGVDKFLEYLFQQKLETKYRVHIVGKVTDPDYAQLLKKFENSQITFLSMFIEDDVLRDLISSSKLVLFTYSKSSILSSGVLMDSLGFGAKILAPNVGAFADLGREGILNNYQDFDELIKFIDQQLVSEKNNDQEVKINAFLRENSWDGFASQLVEKLSPGKIK